VKTQADIAKEMLLSGVNGNDENPHTIQLEKRAAIEAVYDRQLAFTNKFVALYEKGITPSLRDRLHVSDVIGRVKCPRKMVLLHCYQQSLVFHSARQSMIFDMGNLLHGLLQETVSRAVENYEIEPEHEETFWKVIFHPDMIIPFDWDDGNGEVPTILEFKGYGHDYCSNLFPHPGKDGTIIPAKKLPKDAILQANVYMWFTGIRKSLVIVVNKNDQHLWAWPVEYDEKLILPWIPVFDGIKRDIDYHMAHPDRLPKRLDACTSPDDKTPKGCSACTACFSNSRELISLRRPEAWE
jgi:hypothetical protein